MSYATRIRGIRVAYGSSMVRLWSVYGPSMVRMVRLWFAGQFPPRAQRCTMPVHKGEQDGCAGQRRGLTNDVVAGAPAAEAGAWGG